VSALDEAGDGSAPIQPYLAQRLNECDSKHRAAIVQALGFDEGAVGAVVGPPNAGKTALVVSLELAIAMRSERWLGLKVAGGPALYFGSEAPGSVIMRARAAAQRMGACNPPLYISKAVPGLGGEGTAVVDATRIIETARAIAAEEGEAVRIIAIDTLAACLGDGDENSDGMLRLVGAAQRIALATSAFVLLIHHPSKGDAAGLRGHGSLAAACDSILRIDVDELTKIRTATLIKARDAATGLQLRYELEQVILDEKDSFGDPVSTIVVKPTTQEPAKPRPSGKRQSALLNELERRHRTGERGWDEATIRQAARDIGIPKSSTQDALKSLVTAGYLDGTTSSLVLRFPPRDGTK
jgi:putative DNA primase/helicase